MEEMDVSQLNLEILNLKKEISLMREGLREDLEFAVRTELAWQEHDRGKFKSMPADKFLEYLEKC